MSSIEKVEHRRGHDGIRPLLTLIATPRSATDSSWDRSGEERIPLKLTFGELTLIHKSLQAVKTLGALPPQDELLADTIQLVDLALKSAI
jgi:hypothetical protein